MINFKHLKEYLIIKNIKIFSTIADNFKILKIASLINANTNDITFFDDEKLINYLKITKASFCLISNNYVKYLPKTCNAIIVEDPYLAYAHTSNFFYSINNNSFTNKNSSTNKNIFISKKSIIEKYVNIKNNTTIEDGVKIGSYSVIGPNVKIQTGVKIGNSCSISNCIIGKDSIIQSCSVIGGSGFGFTRKDKVEIKHLGNVIIKNNVNIGSNVSIDRASLDSTILGHNVRIDNLVQIAHNVIIGNDTIIASQCGIAGSTHIGNNCTIGGQVGITGHINIGNNVVIAAKSGVTKNISNYSVIAGFPAVDIKKWKKSIIKLYKK